jgi:hypothetical protein
VPNALLSNFFVAGLHSETLVECLKSGQAVNIQPEVLFHMYGTLDRVSNYLPVRIYINIAVLFSSSSRRLCQWTLSQASRSFTLL